MAIAEGLLAIGSAIVGRDLYAQGRTLENLGLAQLRPAELQAVLAEGVHAMGRKR
jgi:opine dehydrogenase